MHYAQVQDDVFRTMFKACAYHFKVNRNKWQGALSVSLPSWSPHVSHSSDCWTGCKCSCLLTP